MVTKDYDCPKIGKKVTLESKETQIRGGQGNALLANIQKFGCREFSCPHNPANTPAKDCPLYDLLTR
jgi:hypothetical protein